MLRSLTAWLILTFLLVRWTRVVYGIIRRNECLLYETSSTFVAERPIEKCAGLFAEAAEIASSDGGWGEFVERFVLSNAWFTSDDVAAAVHWHTQRKWRPPEDAPFSIESLRNALPVLSRKITASDLYDAFRPSDHVDNLFASCLDAGALECANSPFHRSYFGEDMVVVAADMDCGQMVVVEPRKNSTPLICASVHSPADLAKCSEALHTFAERTKDYHEIRNWHTDRELPRWDEAELVERSKRGFYLGISEMLDLGRPDGFLHARRVTKALQRSQAAEQEARRQRKTVCAREACDVLTENRWCSSECCDLHNRYKRSDQRYDCEGCGVPLVGRQERWCAGRCQTIFFNPTYLAAELWEQQHGHCGVCLLMIAQPSSSDAEVDHVEPLAAGGSRTLDNLMITHRACNQAKKAKPLAVARRDAGITAHDISVRLLGIPLPLWVMFRPAEISDDEAPEVSAQLSLFG